MDSTYQTFRQPPFSVLIVACIMALNFVRQFWLKVLPAWQAGDFPELGDSAPSLIFSIILLWGLLTLRSWARSWVLVISAAGTLVPAAVLVLLRNDQFAAGFYSEPRAAILLPMLVVVGLLSGVSFCLLNTPSAKKAFSRS